MPNTGALGSQDQRAYQTTQQSSAGTLSPFSGATAGLLTSPQWSSEAAGYLAGQAGPGIAQSALAESLGSAQLGMVGPQLGVSAAEMQYGTGMDLANALLGYQGIGLQQRGLGAQAQTAAQQQGLEQAQFGVQQGQYPEEQQKAALQNALAVAGMQDQGAISGTLGTQGYKRQQAAQGAEYGWQQADIFRAQQLSELGQQAEQVGYKGQQEQIANQMQQLGLAAKGQGLSAQQAIAQLGFGLQQLGVQANPEQYITAITNAQGQGAQNLAALGSQASLIGGLGPNFTSFLTGG